MASSGSVILRYVLGGFALAVVAGWLGNFVGHESDMPMEKLMRSPQSVLMLMALGTLKQAFTTDVAPILAMARERSGGAIDPVATFRASGYRARKAEERPAPAAVAAGIV